MNQDGDGDDKVEKQKILWVEQYLGTCVLKLCIDFFICPLQNSKVKSPKFTCSESGNPDINYF